MRYPVSSRVSATKSRIITRFVALMSLVMGLVACSTKKPLAPPPPNGPRTATLSLTYGIPVLGIVPMPSGFVPDAGYAPLWLGNGSEIGIVGAANGETGILGLSGPGLSNHRLLASDSDLGGHILDVIPEGAGLAIAVARPAENRLEVIARSPGNPHADHVLAAVDGNFDSAELSQLGPASLALVLLPPVAQQQLVAPGSVGVSSGGVYVINRDQSGIQPLDGVRCALSPLSFSPDGSFAIGQGDVMAAPVIVDLRHQSCHPLGPRIPLKVLTWDRNSGGFLYAARGEGSGMTVLRYDLATARAVRVAVSSSSAAYASDGTIIALGSRDVSARQIAVEPNHPVKAEIALMKPGAPDVTVNSLGFETLPAMLSASTMVFSTVSDDGVIDTAFVRDGAAQRELIEYSYAARAAFVLAIGPPQNPVLMSWSPNGRMLAILDGDANSTTLSVLAPVR